MSRPASEEDGHSRNPFASSEQLVDISSNKVRGDGVIGCE